MKYFLILIMLFTFYSCEEEETKKIKKSPVDTSFRELFSDLELEDRLYIGKIYEGDKLRVRISGSQEYDHYNSVYSKIVKTNYTVRDCMDMPGEPRKHCYDAYRWGKCTLFIQDEPERLVKPIQFTDNPENLNVKLEVGGSVYDFTKVDSSHKLFTIVDFIPTKEQISSSNELFLVLKDNESRSTHQVGLIKLNSCDGYRAKDFSIQDVVPKRYVKESITKSNYIVTIWIKHAK